MSAPGPVERVLSPTVRDRHGNPVLLVQALPVVVGDQLVVSFLETRSPWRQGVRFVTVGQLARDGRPIGYETIIWSDDTAQPVRLDVASTDGTVAFHNVWDEGRGPRWHAPTSGMDMTPRPHGGTSYGCNDDADPPVFDRLVFAVRTRTTSPVPDRGGQLPIHRDAFEGDLDGVRSDLAAGSDPSAPDAAGFTPLHLAVQEGHIGVVRVLVEAGAALDAANRFGATPLHLALMTRHDDAAGIVRLLVAAGADPDVPNVAGITPRALAERLAGVDATELFGG